MSEYRYTGLGFPVKIMNCPLIQVRGVWTPDINLNEFRDAMFRAMADKGVRLTGHELRFIRHYLELTQTEFGARFNVTHAAVSKWEKLGGNPTGMEWLIEKDIRLMILVECKTSPPKFFAKYGDLESVPPARKQNARFDADAMEACVH